MALVESLRSTPQESAGQRSWAEETKMEKALRRTPRAISGHDTPIHCTTLKHLIEGLRESSMDFGALVALPVLTSRSPASSQRWVVGKELGHSAALHSWAADRVGRFVQQHLCENAHESLETFDTKPRDFNQTPILCQQCVLFCGSLDHLGT